MSTAQRGDLAAVVETARLYTTGQPSPERTTVRLGVVTSVTRSGIVKAVRLTSSDTAVPVTIRQQVHVISRHRIDVEGALQVARQHTWPQHDSPMPYASVKEAREAICHLLT